jgi:hypothetical protein
MARPKGALNKATLAKLHMASQYAADAKKLGHKEAVAVLDELMTVAMSFASAYQHKLMAWDRRHPFVEGQSLPEEPPQKLVDRFWLGMNAAGIFAKSLAPYQTPKIAPYKPPPELMPQPELPDFDAKLIEGKELKIKDPIELSRIYRQLVRAV